MTFYILFLDVWFNSIASKGQKTVLQVTNESLHLAQCAALWMVGIKGNKHNIVFLGHYYWATLWLPSTNGEDGWRKAGVRTSEASEWLTHNRLKYPSNILFIFGNTRLQKMWFSLVPRRTVVATACQAETGFFLLTSWPVNSLHAQKPLLSTLQTTR